MIYRKPRAAYAGLIFCVALTLSCNALSALAPTDEEGSVEEQSPVVQPTQQEAVVVEPTPPKQDLSLSYAGIDLTYDLAMGETVRGEALQGIPCDSMRPMPPHLGIFFEPDPEPFSDDPVIAVYSVREFENLCPDPDEGFESSSVWVNNALNPLREAITSQSSAAAVPALPFINAGEVLRVQGQYLEFQNGAGVRAIVMYAQDLWFIHNQAIAYYFQGLTNDGAFYVTVRFPINAPFLIDSPEPSENKNQGAIPIPAYDPSDYEQFAQIVEAYNAEVRRQFEAMNASGFTPDLSVIDALVASLSVNPDQ